MDRRAKFRKNLNDIYLPLYDALCDMLPDHWQPTSGYRSFAEQTKLYNQGRRTEGDIVTRSKPGLSFHNYGLASDWWPCDKKGHIYFPRKEDPIWEEYTQVCTKVGVRCLSWEKPHNEYPLKVSIKKLFDIYQIDGDNGVTEYLKGVTNV